MVWCETKLSFNARFTRGLWPAKILSFSRNLNVYFHGKEDILYDIVAFAIIIIKKIIIIDIIITIILIILAITKCSNLIGS